MDTILAFFGYCRIPYAAVQLAILNEDFVRDVVEIISAGDRRDRERLNEHIETAELLTKFLRSGRRLIKI